MSIDKLVNTKYIEDKWNIYLEKKTLDLRRDFILKQLTDQLTYTIRDICYFDIYNIDTDDGFPTVFIKIHEHLKFHNIHHPSDIVSFSDSLSMFVCYKQLCVNSSKDYYYCILSPTFSHDKNESNIYDYETDMTKTIWNNVFNFFRGHLDYIRKLFIFCYDLERLLPRNDNTNILTHYDKLLAMSDKFKQHLTYIRSPPRVSSILCTILPKDIVTYIIVPYMWYAFLECKDCP